MDDSTNRQWLALALLHFAPRSLIDSLAGTSALRASLRNARRALREQACKDELDAIAARAPLKALPPALGRQLDTCLRWQDAQACHIVTPDQPGYPALLRQLPDPPLALFVVGDPVQLSLPQLAIVGSRKPDAYGLKHTRRLVLALCGAGYRITSGLALGIDAAAHHAALEAGARTIAVLGAGPDTCYPRRHRALADRISGQGALVSEYPPGTPPRAEHFPRRNRLISGLSHGVLVVQAAEASGSLITARLAGSQGREVFVLPGPVGNALSRGCHQLLRQGAVLVETADDVLQELGALVQWQRRELGAEEAEPDSPDDLRGLSEPERELLAAIGPEPVTPDALCVRLARDISELTVCLSALELGGFIVHRDGAWQRQ